MKDCLSKFQIFFIMILIVGTCIIPTSSIWAEQSETTPSLQQISEIIDSYPDISSILSGQLLKEAEVAIQYGISPEDTREIIQKSLEKLDKNIKVYKIIGIFYLLNNLAEDDLPTSLLINKAKEGFAKEVPLDEIILNIREKSENLQFSKYLVDEALLEGADIENKGKAIEILASSLPYNYQEDMITDIVKKGILKQKDVKEIAGALTALSNLINLDISITSAKVITEDLLKEDYSPRDMMTLVNIIAYAQKKGLSVSEINSEIIHRIRKGEDALSIEKGVVDYLKDKEVAAKEDKPSSVTTPSVGEEVITPTQTTPEPPSEDVPASEEPSSDEEVTTPTQTGGPDAP